MGYFKNKNKADRVIRPINPTDFKLTGDKLTWDDKDAVYTAGAIEYLDGEEWKILTLFAPDEEEAVAMPGITDYRLRVGYNLHWSVYINNVKEAEVAPVVIKKTSPKKKK